MAGRGGGGIHGGFISGLGPLGSAGLLGSGGMASRLGSGGLLGGGGRPPTLRWTTTNEGKGTQLGVEGHHGGGEMHEVAAMTGELGGIGPSPSRGELPIVGGTEGQLSQGGGGPPRAPSPELRPKPGSGVPTMVGCGNACGGCYPVLTCCLNFFCCCWRGPMGLQGRPGPMGPPRL
ncbi:PREDICTED: glycine-rich cell wall structural protein 1-like [Nicotiana attenuata]|uniref:Uncharacterized protein n=1 Tax=Nicotiana attenuata TaxID=49451 RepID=A0A1J6KUJ9_NICAT|nr:PREDICTED: glycine-rich cell wall structural protein 1-like [Nicotiana attenuata]OIT28424.1 hypothetical protein A4A49_28872 [Nicotiana attenuata]